jgi:hypothetical protein
MSKIQASVVRSSDNDETPVPLFSGHIIVGIGFLKDTFFNFYDHGVISKVSEKNKNGSYFETPQKVLDDALITSRTRDVIIKKFCSQEFFIFTRLDKTLLTLEHFQREQLDLISQNKKHNLVDSSCIHAAHKGLTQKELEPNVSTQRGYMRAKFAIIPPEDRDFLESLQYAFKKSGLKKSGFERGNEYTANFNSLRP